MKLSGTATLHAPPETVWAALNDPAVLVRTIPGCERLAAEGPDSYHLTVTAGVASIRGTYTGQVSLHDQQAPNTFRMKATGAGGPGTVDTTVAVRLSGDGEGSTLLSYDAEAVIGGVIAGVGQRMLTSVAKRMATDFFTAVDTVLTSQEPVLLPGPQPGAVPQFSASPGAAAAGVHGGAAGGPAGVASPAPAIPVGVSGGVWEAPPKSRQPAGPAAAPPQAFLLGALTGAAVALAGVLVGSLISRKRF